jgi:hypothetical protein
LGRDHDGLAAQALEVGFMGGWAVLHGQSHPPNGGDRNSLSGGCAGKFVGHNDKYDGDDPHRSGIGFIDQEEAMCCIATIALVFTSRIALFLWWLTDRPLFATAFQNWSQPTGLMIPVWIWPLVGGIFVPWTTLVYLFLFPGGIVGYEWIILGVAFLVDIAGHGGTYRHRNRIPTYRTNQTM